MSTLLSQTKLRYGLADYIQSSNKHNIITGKDCITCKGPLTDESKPTNDKCNIICGKKIRFELT